MVHLAIDGMWQVFKLQHSTLRDDFCHVAAKNGILIRLVNTLHSLNEATRLAYVSGYGSHLLTGSTQISDIDRAEMKNLVEESDRRPSHASIMEPYFSAKSSEMENVGGRQQRTSYSGTVRPLLSLLEKEPPSRHVSGQLEYVRHISGFERHETFLPLLHSAAEKKTNGELDFLMAEFAGESFLTTLMAGLIHRS